MRDPYSVLGVQKSADMAEIKKVYRKLAKKFHPDQSKDPKAKEKFAEVGAAYEIIGDEKKRAAFDRGEIDAEGKPRFHGFEGFGTEGAGFGRRSQAGGGPGFQHFEFNFGGDPPGAEGLNASDIFADLFGTGTASWPQGENAWPRRAAAARRGCQCERNNKPRRGGERDDRSRHLADRPDPGGLGSGGNRGWQANPPEAAGPTKSYWAASRATPW